MPRAEGAPAEKAQLYMPDDTVSIEEEGPVSWKTCWIDFRLLWAFTGPGWLMSLAYLDPGNLEADLQMGAYSGTQLIWVLLWSTVMGLVLQLCAARLGVGTGLNLAQQCRLGYSRRTSLALWVLTEVAIIGSDIQEIVGTAIAFQILFSFPLLFELLGGRTALVLFCLTGVASCTVMFAFARRAEQALPSDYLRRVGNIYAHLGYAALEEGDDSAGAVDGQGQGGALAGDMVHANAAFQAQADDVESGGSGATTQRGW